MENLNSKCAIKLCSSIISNKLVSYFYINFALTIFSYTMIELLGSVFPIKSINQVDLLKLSHIYEALCNNQININAH